MHLLHFTQQPSTAITSAIYGSFSAPLAQELVLARGHNLELFLISPVGALTRLTRQETFSHIRALASIRLAGQTKDYIVVSTDSGRLTILSITPTLQFKREACETYGKWGLRRVVPGQFLAADPKGRAVMLAAVEKDKLVFSINRNASDQLVVASPLEANKSHAITFSLAALDVGYDNPVFAALEVMYDDGERASKETPHPEPAHDSPKEVVFYELDLGLNHVVRKSATKVDPSAHLLVAVPGGVLVCANDALIYLRPNQPSAATLSLPRRGGDARAAMLISHAAFATPDIFFALIQTERGDLFKCVVDTAKHALTIKYFDTIPPTTHMCITLRGLLFCAAETGDHELYRFKSVGDDPDDDGITASTDSPPPHAQHFKPRASPRNLDLFETLRSAAPVAGMLVDDLAREDVPQIYTLSGRNSRSSLRVLRQGLAVTELASTKLPAQPRGVWTIRDGDVDRLIVVSSPDSTTLVLKIDFEGIEEIKTSGLQLDVSTIFTTVWGPGQVLQVTHRFFSRVDLHTGQPLQEPWRLHGHKHIECASANSKQLVIALAGGEIIYFEADSSGMPVEVGRYDNGCDVSSLDVSPKPSRFLVIGSSDKQVKIMSLDRANLMISLSTQLLPERPSSVCLVQAFSINDPARVEIGLINGLLVRSILDSSGVISDTRTHVLGSRIVRCQRVGQGLTLCCTSRPWLARGGMLTPLSFMSIDHAAPFCSQHAKDGLVVISGRSLRVVSLEPDMEQRFNEQARQLAYTPRRVCRHPNQRYLIVLEGELGSAAIKTRKGAPAETISAPGGKQKPTKMTKMELDEDEDNLGLPTPAERVTGYARIEGGSASLVRVFDPTANKTIQALELDPNELAISCEVCSFGDQAFVAVGTVTEYKPHHAKDEPAFTKAGIRLYSVTNNQIKFEHTTPVLGMPTALCAFDGRLLAGVGNSLVLLDLGKKQLLRKCELKGLPSQASFILAQGSERIMLGDQHDSCFAVSYNKIENAFFVFADDVTSRMSNVGDMVDYNSVAVGDKNGSIYVLRLPSGATGDDTKSRAAAQRPNNWDQSQFVSVPHKLDLICHFYVGECVTGIRKCQLSMGHSETLCYSTISGAVGTLCPFPSRDDLDFFAHLELNMRKYYVNLVGRDHLQFRSYYAPVKQVVDGDLCELFGKLDVQTQQKIAKELDKTPTEIVRRIEDARALVLW